MGQGTKKIPGIFKRFSWLLGHGEGLGVSISRFPALPPYLSIIPPDGIVGEGI